MLKFVPIIMWNGFSVAILAALFVPLITRTVKEDIPDAEKNQKAMSAMIAIGFGEAIGGIFNGQMCDRLGSKKFILLFIIELSIAFILLISYNEYD
jgi:MFS-type transporter involved in bile tolerance (Atg22 family)